MFNVKTIITLHNSVISLKRLDLNKIEGKLVVIKVWFRITYKIQKVLSFSERLSNGMGYCVSFK